MNNFKVFLVVFAVATTLAGAICPARAQEKNSPYPKMAPLSAYMMAQSDEVALARTGAPKSISDDADVIVLGQDGYTTAAKGKNGFVCIVERMWGAGTDDPEFWNPKVRSPICFNPAAAKTYLPIYLMKTKLALEGKSNTEIAQAIASAFDKKELPALEPGAMCYMMSKRQYLSDRDKSWHPHLMFFVAGDVDKSWGANLPGSPIIGGNDPEERVTIFMVERDKWSDGTPAPMMD
jgi:hypothetical protein